MEPLYNLLWDQKERNERTKKNINENVCVTFRYNLARYSWHIIFICWNVFTNLYLNFVRI